MAMATEAQTRGASGDIQPLVKHLPMEPTGNTSRGDRLAKNMNLTRGHCAGSGVTDDWVGGRRAAAAAGSGWDLGDLGSWGP